MRANNKKTNKNKKELKGDSKKVRFSWAKGAIGLVVLIGIIVGAAYFVINLENTKRVESGNEAIASGQPTTNSEEQCFTIPANIKFTSGSPVWDQILVYALTNKANNPAYAEFITNYETAGRLDVENATYKEIVEKVDKGSKDIKPYLQIGPDGKLALAPADDPNKYEQALTEHPEGMYKGGLYLVDVRVYRTTDGAKESTNETYVVGISEKAGENDIVFPIQNKENSVVDGFDIARLLPICK